MSTKKTSKCSFSVIEIFERIKKHLNIDKDIDLAAFFGEPPKKLATWKTRNTIPFELLIQKSIEGHFDFYEILNLKTTKCSDAISDSIPLMQWCDAGHGWQEIPIDWNNTLKIPGVPTTGTYGLKVVSDSMASVVFPGDILICREIPLNMLRIGYTYVFITEKGTDIKQYFYDNGLPRLRSYNRVLPDFHPVSIYRCFAILRVIHEYRDVETVELNGQLGELNRKLEVINLKLGVSSHD